MTSALPVICFYRMHTFHVYGPLHAILMHAIMAVVVMRNAGCVTQDQLPAAWLDACTQSACHRFHHPTLCPWP